MKKGISYREKNFHLPKGRKGSSLRISLKRFSELMESFGLDTQDYNIGELYLSVLDSLGSLEKLDQADLKRMRLGPAFYPQIQRKDE